MFGLSALARCFPFHLNHWSVRRAAITAMRGTKIHRQRLMLSTVVLTLGLDKCSVYIQGIFNGHCGWWNTCNQYLFLKRYDQNVVVRGFNILHAGSGRIATVQYIGKFRNLNAKSKQMPDSCVLIPFYVTSHGSECGEDIESLYLSTALCVGSRRWWRKHRLKLT